MWRWRLGLGVAGVLVGGYGVVRLFIDVPITNLLALLGWLIAAVVVHDGLIAPGVIGVGAVLTRVPPRLRKYLQSGLITAALVTVIALPLIALRDSQPAAKAILQRNYAAGLGVLIGIIAGVTLLRYAVRVVRDRRR